MGISAGSSLVPTEPHQPLEWSRCDPSHLSRVSCPMQLADFLDCDAIKTSLPGGNKRSLLQQLANLAAQRLGVEAAAVSTALNEREQLGSTGFGQGVAIPH